MRQALVRLGSKAKLGRSSSNPSVERAGTRIRAEGVVHFNGVEFSSVMLEQFFSWKLGGIEIWLPGCVCPTGGADVDLVHGRIVQKASL